jgi:hypothetical protein
VFSENGWGTKAVSEKVTVTITCDALSTTLTEAAYPDGFGDYQIVDRNSELNTKFVLPTADSSDPKCPYESIKVVISASVDAPLSDLF